MTRHPRSILAQEAKAAILEELYKIDKKFELTTIEWLITLQDSFNSQVASILKYELRRERHGDINKPADILDD